ncbi:SAP190 [Candida theae]|uniref:SAP190 n=1 Tax=Candida theae TaxID=1198502 RepID=A0AAD5G0E7_9ASCO|nr:SAP190 [Candida theae]KAI5965009.1 SAP190 [Candida theae]
MSGSFWKFSNGFTSLSNITTLLENYNSNQEQNDSSSVDTNKLKDEQRDVLIKLLDENDLLQELLSNNPMLLEFLRDEHVLSMLVDIVISNDAATDTQDEKNKKGEENFSSEEKAVNATTSIDDQDSSSSDSKTEKKTRNNESSDEQRKQGKFSKKGDGGDSDDQDEEEGEEEKENDDDEEEEEDDDVDDDDDDDDDDESPEEVFRRRATLASEVLSADVWSLTDTVMESTENLNKLWGVLGSKNPLDIHVSTHFMKIMEHLLDMKCDEMITYLIDNQPNLVEKFINHLSNPPLMDFLLKLISTDKPDNSTGIIEFLQNQDLISHLISALDVSDVPETEKEKSGGDGKNHELLLIEQSSAADFLKALITISANSTADNSTIGPNELTRELVSKEKMTRLCDIMLKGGYALANGVGIIIEIIRKNNSDYDILPVLYITLESHPPTGRDPIYLGHLLRVFGERISDFNKLLIKEHTDSKLKTPFGVIQPLGFERFKICELVAELLHCSNMALLNDNKGFDVVKERDELREKMKEYDPISFKYNEAITLPREDKPEENEPEEEDKQQKKKKKSETDETGDTIKDDTIDEFNKQDETIDEDEPHANSNLTEEQIRANPVVGDFLKIALFDTQIISNILSMFFRFPWNNFLHNVVFDVVQQVLNGSMDIGFNKFLAIDLFHSADITNKIIEGQRLCNDYETSHNGLRLGFMGHLTLIAEEVVKFVQLFPSNTLSEYINEKIESDVWDDYVSNVLYDTREKYNAILGGNEDEDDRDDEEDNTTFEEGLGEIIEEVKTGLVFQDDEEREVEEAHDENAGDDRHENEKEKSGKSGGTKSKKDLLDSDESESDEDDHFSNYMSQQLANTSNNANQEHEESSSEEEEDDDKHVTHEDDGDDYIDPNDDGMSYKKSNPLYDSSGELKNAAARRKFDDDDDEDEDLSNSSSDEEEEGEDVDAEASELTRSASKN